MKIFPLWYTTGKEREMSKKVREKRKARGRERIGNGEMLQLSTIVVIVFVTKHPGANIDTLSNESLCINASVSIYGLDRKLMGPNFHLTDFQENQLSGNY